MKKFAVTFRKDTDKLTSMCSITFKTTKEAKKHIEDDAHHLCELYNAVDLGWIKPKTLDYYCVEMKNGVKCYWQYFQLG